MTESTPGAADPCPEHRGRAPSCAPPTSRRPHLGQGREVGGPRRAASDRRGPTRPRTRAAVLVAARARPQVSAAPGPRRRGRRRVGQREVHARRPPARGGSRTSPCATSRRSSRTTRGSPARRSPTLSSATPRAPPPAIGAAGGAVAAAEWAAMPVLVAVPLEVVVETLAVAAVEVKLVAELHAVYGVPVQGTGTQRAHRLHRFVGHAPRPRSVAAVDHPERARHRRPAAARQADASAGSPATSARSSRSSSARPSAPGSTTARPRCLGRPACAPTCDAWRPSGRRPRRRSPASITPLADAQPSTGPLGRRHAVDGDVDHGDRDGGRGGPHDARGRMTDVGVARRLRRLRARSTSCRHRRAPCARASSAPSAMQRRGDLERRRSTPRRARRRRRRRACVRDSCRTWVRSSLPGGAVVGQPATSRARVAVRAWPGQARARAPCRVETSQYGCGSSGSSTSTRTERGIQPRRHR